MAGSAPLQGLPRFARFLTRWSVAALACTFARRLARPFAAWSQAGACALFAALACGPAPAALAAGPARAGNDQLVFIITGGKPHPLLKISGSEIQNFSLAPPRVAGEEDASGGERVPRGRPLHLYSQGQALGAVRAGRTVVANNSGCGDPDYVEPAADAVGVPDTGIAATRPLRASTVAPRAPTAAERERLLQMAEVLLRKHGSAPALRRRLLAAAHVAVVQVRAGRPPALLAWMNEDRDEQTHALFFIAEADAAGAYAPTYVDLQDGGDSASESAVYGSGYLEHADLDGDGDAEIVITRSAYETSSYEVLRKTGKTWSSVAGAFAGGC